MAIKTEKSSPQSDREQTREGEGAGGLGRPPARLELVPDPDRASERDAEPAGREGRQGETGRETGERRQDGASELDAEQGRE